ncbi:homoserine dehydrogenase [Allobaculum mucilyticum]|uniref:homoserine dehydrogenase n=1 Tax=Allobaculum mucilyticum TaxID=2834459 RepID=UPI001E4802F9|nr:homoserine dehydrogenase [Allobaculum mucilyticum]UNT96622.1 homoserine dehydrogenase [Allobaculum mucilyticum]
MNCALLGYGTVGSSVKKLADRQPGLDIRIVFVKPEFVDLPFFSNEGEAIVTDPDTEIVFECLAGVEPANTLIRKALEHGKHVISSNKAVLSANLPDYIELARKHGGSIQIEASVGGGIPLIDGILKLDRAEELKGFEGILNGTSNYILTSMEKFGTSFDDALKAAQAAGYAEADPANDIEGRDVWYKTLLVASLYTHSPVLTLPEPLGISKLSAEDIDIAKAHGKKIRHLSILKNESGSFSTLIAPVFLNENDYLASVDENFNAQKIYADSFGSLGYYGPGAGGDPTAQAMIADAINLLDGCRRPITLDRNAVYDPNLIQENWIVRTDRDLSSLPGVNTEFFDADNLYLFENRTPALIEEVRVADPQAMIAVWR